ncbi:hypothetical protein Tco_1132587 [Tanacetum coccineum]|uniref:MAK10-like protein n=1 Tax=Tanacetum coccineum TaxID=301880 RepID=A0ABQ5JDG7_9ASTR
MHVFIGNFTYIVDFMIIEDISSIIDPRMSQVVLGKPFMEISNMTHDPQEGVVRFTNRNDKVAYKMPHKIEQYNSLSNLEKEHTKSVYLKNEEDKRRGVDIPRPRKLQELKKIPAFIDSRLESIKQLLNRFIKQPNKTSINDPEPDNGSVDTPLVSPFPHPDNDSDDEEVLNELCEYENTGTLRRERIINSFDRDNLAFECMIGFRKFTAYLDPFLPMNIISRKAYNTIMVDRLEGTGKNLIAIVRDVYVFVGSFTYIMDFVVLEDIEEFIMSNMAEVLMGRPFRKITKLKYDVAKGLVSFTKIFNI